MARHLYPLRMLLIFGGCILLLPACRNKKQLATAKANAVNYGLARCECEKQQRKHPPGNTDDCTQAMAKATRYMNINFEFGNFNEAERADVHKAGNDAYDKCINTGP